MTEGIFEYTTETRGGETRAVVTGLTHERRHLEVPDRLGGFPVRGIGSQALSRQDRLCTVHFPPSLRSVGSFALQHCPRLQEVSFYDGIEDFHNGVFRQDPHLQRIRLILREENYRVMRDILSDTDISLQFCLELPGGEARLFFPGYNYSFAENTMARTIQFSIRGSGMEYRDCVRRKEVGWWEYDRLFHRAVHDDPRAAIRIAADRLMYPWNLAPVHAEAYEEYLRTKAGEALLLFLEELEGDMEEVFGREGRARLQMMADRGLYTAQDADAALRRAAEAGLAEAGTILLDGRRDQTRQEPPDTLSLDDW